MGGWGRWVPEYRKGNHKRPTSLSEFWRIVSMIAEKTKLVAEISMDCVILP